MSAGDTPDLFSIQRELLSQWEKGVNELLVKHMSSGDLSKQTKLLGVPAQLKKSTDKILDKFPATKGDLVQLETRLKAIEDLLGRAMVILEGTVPEPESPTTPTRAPRTRRYQPPKKG